MGLLRQGLHLLEQIPHALSEVVVRLGDLALVDHARDERVPPAGVERAVLELGGPPTAQQQLALVGLVAGVQDRMQQFGLPAVAGVAEGVVELRRVDRPRAEDRRDAFDQRGEALAVLDARGAVGVGRLLDRLEHQPQERAAELAVHALGPLLDAREDGLGELQLDPRLLAVGDRGALARDLGRDADLLHAREQLVGGFFDVEEVAVDFHLARALGELPHGAQLVVQAAQLFHGQLVQGLRVDHRGVDAGLERGVHGRVVLGHGLHVREGRLPEALGHAVLGQDGAHRVDDIGVAPALDDLLVVALGDLAEELEDLLHLGLGVMQRLGGVVVQELVALGLHRRLGVALGGGLLPALGGAGLGGAVLVGGVAQVFHPAPRCQVLGELLGCLGERVDRDGAAVAGGAAGGLPRVQHLGLGLELCRQRPGAGLVVHRLVGGLLDCTLVDQVAVALEHALFGHAFDHLVDRRGVDDGAHQRVARLEAEHIGHQVRMQAVLGGHPAQAREVRPGQHGLGVHLGQGVGVEAETLLGLHQVAGSGVDGLALLEPAHGPVDRLLLDLGAHLGLDLFAQLGGLLLQRLDGLVAGVDRPLQVAQAASLQLLNRLVGGVEVGQHAGGLLGLGDLLVGGDHAVEHLADVIGHLQVAALHELLQALVGADHPRPEAAEQRLQLLARGLALEQVLLERLRQALVIRALLVQGHRIPNFERGAPRGLGGARRQVAALSEHRLVQHEPFTLATVVRQLTREPGAPQRDLLKADALHALALQHLAVAFGEEPRGVRVCRPGRPAA